MIRLFQILIPIAHLVLILLDFLILGGIFLLASILTMDVPDLGMYLFYENGLTRIAPVLIILMFGLYFEDLYSRIYVYSRIYLAQQVLVVVGATLLAQSLIYYVAPSSALEPGTAFLAMGIVVVVFPFWRFFWSSFLLERTAETILVVGYSSVVQEMVEHLQKQPDLNLRITGYVLDEMPLGTQLEGGPVIGSIRQLTAIAIEQKPDLIVVGFADRRAKMPVDELLDLRFKGFRIEEASTTFEHICHRVCSKDLRPAQLIFYGSRGPRPYGYRSQGLVNFLVAAFGFIVALPIMIVTAVLVKLTSPGPIFFSQVRVGLNNRTFKLYKFRSMRADAEKGTGAVWATRNDPRVTSIGKWLRKLRIDELPQLINVLKGEMSMVGPRPERPEFVDQLARQIPYYRQRLAVRPGVTGWAQINHRYGDTLEDTIRKVEYDLYYIKHLAFTLDIYIIFHTIKTMLLRRGAQ